MMAVDVGGTPGVVSTSQESKRYETCEENFVLLARVPPVNTQSDTRSRVPEYTHPVVNGNR